MKFLYGLSLNFKIVFEFAYGWRSSVCQGKTEQVEDLGWLNTKSVKGQITVEYLLLAVTLIALFHLASLSLRDNESLKNFQEIPGQIFKNLVENGNWKIDENLSRANHPNHHDRHYTPEGNGPT